jgi:hypothetical protein
MEKAPSCPRCHSPHVVPILYGKPDHEGIALAQRGEVMLGGCVCSGSDPIWFCHECHATIYADSAHDEWYDHGMPMRSW